MNFHENLKLKYNSLTKQGKKIADFLSLYPNSAIKMTAKALAEASSTSAPTVIRFCQKLGYESMELMKLSLAKSLSDDELTQVIDTVMLKGDNIAESAQKLYGTLHNALHDTLELLDYNKINNAVTLLSKASRIYLFGVGSSNLAAYDLCHKLNRIGKYSVFLHDGHTNLEYVSSATKNDIVIAFSYSGETKEVYLAAKWAKQKDVPVIAVTRNRPSTLSKHSSIVINIAEGERRVRIGSFGSTSSQMYIADILYLGIVQRDFSNYENLLIKSAQITRQLRE